MCKLMLSVLSGAVTTGFLGTNLFARGDEPTGVMRRALPGEGLSASANRCALLAAWRAPWRR